MSAYIVNDAAITAIVRAGIAYKLIKPASASLVGQALKAENVASVSCRYPYDLANGERLSGRFDDPMCEPIVRSGVGGQGGMAIRSVTYRYVKMTFGEPRLDMHKVRSVISCYRYQSCEHPEWEGSPAEVFTAKLDHVLTERGYDGSTNAVWSIEDISEVHAS